MSTICIPARSVQSIGEQNPQNPQNPSPSVSRGKLHHRFSPSAPLYPDAANSMTVEVGMLLGCMWGWSSEYVYFGYSFVNTSEMEERQQLESANSLGQQRQMQSPPKEDMIACVMARLDTDLLMSWCKWNPDFMIDKYKWNPDFMLISYRFISDLNVE